MYLWHDESDELTGWSESDGGWGAADEGDVVRRRRLGARSPDDYRDLPAVVAAVKHYLKAAAFSAASAPAAVSESCGHTFSRGARSWMRESHVCSVPRTCA